MTSDVQTANNALRLALLRDFKAFYGNGRPELEQLGDIYTEDIEFRDPVHSLRGRLALRRYISGMYANCEEVRFRYTDEQIGEHGASIAWEMTFRHPRIRKGQAIEVRGLSLVHFTDRIYYHEDFYDMGSMIYQHVPVLGRMVRYINRKLAG